MIRYLDHEEVLIIHARILDETGGLHGVRDIHGVASALGRPKMQFGGADLYPSLFEKAAAYFSSLAFDHPFLDGNKRTAIVATARFLFLNGYELRATNKILEKFVLRAVVEKYEIKKIAAWLEKHSRKRKAAQKH
ncbi:MAG: type II toxin-antitoxin system death-on-curing family toxin [Candidatus Sungbacteria bacterium]|nr:type II toxin-antitoxin system death-on-curing family toxin [Candidatus Sungbacteria bacterium]